MRAQFLHEGVDRTLRRALSLNKTLRFFQDGWARTPEERYMAEVSLAAIARQIRLKNHSSLEKSQPIKRFFDDAPCIRWTRGLPAGMNGILPRAVNVSTGEFESTMDYVLPAGARTARFMLVRPHSWDSSGISFDSGKGEKGSVGTLYGREKSLLDDGSWRTAAAIRSGGLLGRFTAPWWGANSAPLARVEPGAVATHAPAKAGNAYENNGAFAGAKKSDIPRALMGKSSVVGGTGTRPVAIVLSPTGDHGYFRRFASISLPLANMGIGSILLQHPFYAERKPPGQVRSSLRCVSDLLTMGAALYSEINSLLAWLTSHGYGPLVLSGMSLGGHVASFVGTTSPYSPGIVPVLAPHNAGTAFFGVFNQSVDWEALAKTAGSVELAREQMRKWFELTELADFPPPENPQHAIVLSAAFDQYATGSGKVLASHWGCEHRETPAGHVTGFLLLQREHISAIADVVSRMQ